MRLSFGNNIAGFRVRLVGGVKNWDDEKLFCLVGEKKRRMKNVIYID